MTFPNSNLPVDAQRWGREIQKRVETIESSVVANEINNAARDKQLAASYTRLDKTVTELAATQGLVDQSSTNLSTITASLDDTITQLNAAVATGMSTLAYTGADAARTNDPVARFTFVKPSWATKAAVECVASVSAVTTDNAGSPIVGTMTAAIDGVKAKLSTSLTDPTPTATDATQSISTNANNVVVTATQGHARSFTTAGNVVVEAYVTKSASGASASFKASVSATVFWSK